MERGLTLWVLLEINFLCFMGIITQTLIWRNSNINLYYFLIQALGSVVILIRLFLRFISSLYLCKLIFFLSLLLKLGRAPFQFWYLKLIQKLNWRLLWILSIWQKLIPLILLSLINTSILIFFGLLRTFVGGLRRIRQKNLKKILGLSSIFSLGWLIVSFMINNNVWLLFITGYGATLLILIFLLKRLKMETTLKSDLRFNPIRLVIFITSLLMLRGIPPFIGFFIKISILIFLLDGYLLISFIILIIRLYLIFVYLIIGFSLLTYLKTRNKLGLQTLDNKLIIFDLLLVNIIIPLGIFNFIFFDYIT